MVRVAIHDDVADDHGAHTVCAVEVACGDRDDVIPTLSDIPVLIDVVVAVCGRDVALTVAQLIVAGRLEAVALLSCESGVVFDHDDRRTCRGEAVELLVDVLACVRGLTRHGSADDDHHIEGIAAEQQLLLLHESLAAVSVRRDRRPDAAVAREHREFPAPLLSEFPQRRRQHRSMRIADHCDTDVARADDLAIAQDRRVAARVAVIRVADVIANLRPVGNKRLV